jgi:hypothetical protein
MTIRFSYKGKTPYKPTAMRATTEKQVRNWRDKIIFEKLDPWWGRGEHGGMQVDVTMRSGKPIHMWGSTFNGSPRQVFWSDDFIPPFLDDAIEDVLQGTATTCRKHGLPPDDYLREAAGFLWGLVHTVYDRMAEMEECADHRAHPRRDVSEYVDKMLPRIEDHVKAAKLLAESDKKPNGHARAGDAMPTNGSSSAAKAFNIQNSTVVIGAGNVVGDHNSIGKEMPTSEKNKTGIKRIVTASVVFLAGLLTILQILFGWIGAIRRFLTNK